MPPHAHAAAGSWSVPIGLTSALLLTAFLYLRGWRQLLLTSSRAFPVWRAASFFIGLFSIWIAIGSPLAFLDMELLTAHMVQHLLLMTFAAPLIWLGAPVLVLHHALPQRFVQGIVAPFFRWSPVRRLGRVISQPVFCWLAPAAVLVGWHIPAVFAFGMRSEAWHGFEQASFLVAGLLFWWPVVRPWPAYSTGPRWSILLYLFLATVPCDILSGFLAFCDRVVYHIYLDTPRRFGLSALEDQQCAAALMWACVTVVYLVPAAILTVQMLSQRKYTQEDLRQPPQHAAVSTHFRTL
jgi:putative membrane protein